MGRTLESAAAGLLILLVAGCSRRHEAPPGRWLTVSASDFDFGEVWHGDRPHHDFLVRNRGPQRVVLRGYRNACSCTRVTFEVLDRSGRRVARPIYDPPERIEGDFRVTTLEPGETLRVRVTVHTELRPPEDHPEPGTTELYFLPDTEVGRLRLTYRFFIRARVRVLPTPAVELGRLGKEQRTLSWFELSPGPGKPPFEVLGIDGTDEVLRLEEVPAKTRHGHRYLVRFGPRGRVGAFHRELRIHTDLDREALGGQGYTVKVQVYAETLPNVEFFPIRRLDLSRFPFSESRETFLTLIYHGKREDPGFSIVGVRAKLDGERDVSDLFEAWIDDGGEGRWFLRLRYAGGAVGHRIQGYVILATKDPECPRTTIPFTAFHRNRS